MDIYNIVSFFGIFIFTGLAWLISEDRKSINWKVVKWGLALQLIFALIIFVFPAGTTIFFFFFKLITVMLDSAIEGAEFLFGPLALSPGQKGSYGFILAFQAFPSIIFFSACLSLLYYFNIMQKVIKVFAFLFTRLMKVSGAESFVAASNIFVGVESALTVKPYLKKFTRSEFCTILTAGMATVSSNVLAIYVFALNKQFPNIGAHLISASLLSAPAALIMSKILVPETENPVTADKSIDPCFKKEKSIIAVIIKASQTGLKMIAGISALLIAVLGLVSLVDSTLFFLGTKFNTLSGFSGSWSLKGLAGYIFFPFALITGIPVSEAYQVAKLIGGRLIVTEVAAYQDLAVMIDNGMLSTRSIVVTTYALCGFAHLASLAVFTGGISSLVPERINTISSAGVKSLLAATLACLMTACIAGTFFGKTSLLFNI